MDSPTTPYQPYIHQKNHASSALASRGMEIAIPPGQLPPRPSSIRYASRELPPIPKHRHHDLNRQFRSRSAPGPLDGQPLTASLSQGVDREDVWRPILGSKAYSAPSQQLPPPPTMTKSSEKIPQLMGFDPRFEKGIPKGHQQQQANNSESSGSAYSQPEGGIEQNKVVGTNNRAAGPSNPMLEDSVEFYLQSSTYTTSEQGQTTNQPVQSLRHKDRPTARKGKQKEDIIPVAQVGQETEQLTTLHELLAQERLQHSPASNDIHSPSLAPKPLALRSKKKPQPLTVEKRVSWLEKARDSFDWGVEQITPTRRNKQFTPPFSPINEGPGEIKMEPKIKRNRFGNAKYPLKSPYPFREMREVEDKSPTELKSPGRFSRAIHHYSRSDKSAPTERTVISHAARKPNGPSIPTPVKSAFMNFHGVVRRVRVKAGGLGKEEREDIRREKLKKKIQVIGLGDQTPGECNELLLLF